MHNSVEVDLRGDSKLVESSLWGADLVLGLLLAGFLTAMRCTHSATGSATLLFFLPRLRPTAMDPASLSPNPLKLRANKSLSCQSQ